MPFYTTSEVVSIRSNTVNLNTTGDVFSVSNLPTKIIVDRMEMFNWSTTPAALLALTLRDASAAGGNSLLGAIVTLSTPITATSLAAVATPLASVLGANRVVTTGAFFVNLSAANGSALTADLLITYRVL